MKKLTFDFISETHLGDCLLHAHFMRKVVERNPNIHFNFFLIDKHWDQTFEYISDVPQINCLPYDQSPSTCLRGWVGQFGIPPLPCPLDGLRLNSYKLLSHQMGITCPFDSEYDLLYDNSKIKTGYNTPSYDILLINSTPLSNQIAYDAHEYVNFVDRAQTKGYSIITSNKIDGVPCTVDLNLSVMGIGHLSTKCRVIVGIGTGAMQCCLNIWNKDKRFLYIDKHHTFNMKNITMIHNVSQVEI